MGTWPPPSCPRITVRSSQAGAALYPVNSFWNGIWNVAPFLSHRRMNRSIWWAASFQAGKKWSLKPTFPSFCGRHSFPSRIGLFTTVLWLVAMWSSEGDTQKSSKIFTCRQNRLKAFTLRFDRSEYFDRAHVRGLGFLVWDTVVFGAYITSICLSPFSLILCVILIILPER